MNAVEFAERMRAMGFVLDANGSTLVSLSLLEAIERLKGARVS